MSKPQRPLTTNQTLQQKPIVPVVVDDAPQVQQTGTEPIKSLAGQDLKPHRQCPLCWSRSKGYGTAYSTAPNGRTYYKCDHSLTEHSPCGHTWSVVIGLQAVTITHRVVTLDGMR